MEKVNQKVLKQRILSEPGIIELGHKELRSDHIVLNEEFALQITLFDQYYLEFMISLYTILGLINQDSKYSYVIELNLIEEVWDIYAVKSTTSGNKVSFNVNNKKIKFQGILLQTFEDIEDFMRKVKVELSDGNKDAVIHVINEMIYQKQLIVTNDLIKELDNVGKTKNTQNKYIELMSIDILSSVNILKLSNLNSKIFRLFQQYLKEKKYEEVTIRVDDYLNWLLNYSIDFPVMPRILKFIYENRIDLQRTYPNDKKEFEILILEWFIKYGFKEMYLDELVNIERLDEFEKRIIEINKILRKKIFLKLKNIRTQPESLNVIAYFDCALGLSQAAKNYEEAFNHISIKWNKILRPPTSSPKIKLSIESDLMLSETNLVIANGDQMRNIDMLMPNYWKSNKKTIGIWSWEIEAINEDFLNGSIYLDEIWFISEFARNGMKDYLEKRNINSYVLNIPIPAKKLEYIEENNTKSIVLKFFKKNCLETKNYIFFNFDFLSDVERKNPEDLIKVFNIVKERQGNQNLKLLIKTINGNLRPEELKKLKSFAILNDSITIIDDTWDKEFLDFVIGNAKIYISLHRAEGFGMGLAEAMSRGIPVMGTGYGGNLEFMDDSNSLLINYSLQKIERNSNKSYFDSGGRWAVPEIDDAVDKLTYGLENESVLANIALAGQKTILNNFSIPRISNKILGLLNK
jgi:glycosyltransferase involved in cell wall biosynthesis